MKQLMTLAILLVSVTSIQAQGIFSAFQVKKAGITASFDQDRLRGIDQDYMLGSIRSNSDLQYAESFGETDLYSAFCENPSIRAEVSLVTPKMLNSELRLAVNFMPDRIDGVRYRRTNSMGEMETLHISSTTHELAIEAGFIKYAKAGPFSLYGGPGTNLGMSFGGYATVDGDYMIETVDDKGDVVTGTESFREYTSPKTGIHQRIYLTGGAAITFFQRLELAWEGRYGYGYRAINGAGLHGTQLVSLGLSAKWVLR